MWLLETHGLRSDPSYPTAAYVTLGTLCNISVLKLSYLERIIVPTHRFMGKIVKSTMLKML